MVVLNKVMDDRCNFIEVVVFVCKVECMCVEIIVIVFVNVID